MHCEVKHGPLPSDFPIADLPIKTAGIITEAAAFVSSKTGDPVIRFVDYVWLPRLDICVPLENVKAFRVRPLLAGEQIILTK